MFFRTFAVFSAAAVMAGCGLQPPITQSESFTAQSPVAILLIPAPVSSGVATSNSPQDIASTVRFKNYQQVGTGEYPDVESLQWKVQGAGFAVEKYKAFIARSGRELSKVSVTYDGAIDTTRAGSNFKLAFLLSKKTYYAEPNILTGKASYQVEFTPTDVATNLANAEISWKYEIDSKYNTDSSYANFARLTRKEIFKGDGQKDAMTGKIFTERFWVRVSGRAVALYVVTYPYRNGSKVVVTANIPGVVTGNSVDFVSISNALKKEVERIVNS